MDLEKQVVSLELSQKLKELGVKQESLYYWVNIDIDEYVLIHSEEVNLDDNCTSAFTVAELGEMLPPLYKSYRYAGTGEWCVNLVMGAREKTKQYPNTMASTEADARAKMLIYLLENKLI